MDLKQLRTFQAVAELGSLSKAADRLRTTLRSTPETGAPGIAAVGAASPGIEPASG